MFVTSLAVASQAPETRLADEGETVGNFSTDSSDAEYGIRASACATDLVCFDGRYIGCQASGAVTRCQRNSRLVVCEAWGTYGDYSRAVDYCY